MLWNSSLTVTLKAPPANDNFTSAIALSGSTLSVRGNLLGATVESSESELTGAESLVSCVAFDGDLLTMAT